MPKFRVLALDGGGVRGLMTAMLLERLCLQPGLEHAFDHVDLVAGNSSGALVALAMADGLGRPTMLETLGYTQAAFERARDVFGRPRYPAPLDRIAWFFKSKYLNRAREESVKKLLNPGTRLRDLKTSVLITSFDLENVVRVPGRRPTRMWKPKIFHNFIGPDSDRELFAWQVALYSTAAITYFPSVDGFVDGGVYANNPSMCALAQVFDERYLPKPKPLLEDVLLFSVGAGQNLESVPGQTVSWGLIRWAWGGRFVSLTSDATVGVADYECRQLLTDSNYKRLNPDFGGHASIPLDDFDALDYIKMRLESPEVEVEIQECAEWLREHWMVGRTTGPILPEPTSKHVGPATELICVMPIKPGFVPVLDTVSYATRLRAVFKVLQILRTISREQLTLKPVLDIVEAARTVLAFSWTILLEKNLMLNVTFDRPWEPYIRVVWKVLGPLTDLFLCNCEGFVPSTEGFDRFADYVRRHQVETSFFYPASSLTVDDEEYLRLLEKLERQWVADLDHKSTTLTTDGPVERSQLDRNTDPDGAITKWLAVLDVLYGLRNLYPPDAADHIYLHQAAKALLDNSRPPAKLPETAAVVWYDSMDGTVDADPEPRKLDLGTVQGGIQRPYRRISQGCLILAGVKNAAAAREYVGGMSDWVTRGDEDQEKGHPARPADARPGRIYRNVAFSANGLKQLGVNGSVYMRFPKEFREGMDARAGLLGDIRQNHPDAWSLPTTFGSHVPIRMSSVDMVISLNMVDPDGGRDSLTSEIQAFCDELPKNGFQVLCVEHLRRLRPRTPDSEQDKRLSRDHFGFLDGISQPNAVNEPRPGHRDDVNVGEIFVGFQNDRGDGPFPEQMADPLAWERGSLIDAGSFLVVRKLRQYVGALNAVLDSEKGRIRPEELLAKMVGRDRNGKPLTAVLPKDLNDFDFERDNGAVCPFHSHIRRGNPRLKKPARGSLEPQVPRIARRALAYGPDFNGDDSVDRGVMFMAYNASIAEQFEMLQRWMSGGNTPAPDGNTAVFSGQPDPLLGLPDVDGTRVYRFVDGCGQPQHVNLGTQPFVTLQWGLYLFAPSIGGLKLLAREPEADIVMSLAVLSLGEQVIRKLDTVDDWAAAIEDQTSITAGVTAAVFAAIRVGHNGVLRTPYGVLVARKDLAMQVLSSDPTFSVCEYQNRFAKSVGKSYLGMDRGKVYESLAGPANHTLTLVTHERAFSEAYATSQRVIRELRAQAATAVKQQPPGIDDRWRPFPLLPVIDGALALLAREWFDIPDGTLIGLGGDPVNDEDMRCPASCLAPSRYVFSSPNPRDTVKALGQRNGQLLLDRARQFVTNCRDREKNGHGLGLHGPISGALFDAIRHDDERLASTLLGLVFGFVPTVYGNAASVLGGWINDETLWRLQPRFLPAGGDAYEKAKDILWPEIQRTMMARPVPALLHRMVTDATRLGDVDLKTGDRVVICVTAVTQEIQQSHQLDVAPIFGGCRKAPDHPTHACPGYDIATGVLLGMLSAVLEITPSAPAPALVTIRVPW